MKNTVHAVYQKRRDKLRRTLSSKKADAFLTLDFADVFYLTGFPSEGCFILVGRSGDYLFSPLLLSEHVKDHVRADPELTGVYERSLLKALQDILQKDRLKKIGYDPEKLTVSLYGTLSRFKRVQWTGLPALVLNQRMIKDAEEIRAISEACRITVECQEACFKGLSAGRSEKQVAAFVENLFKESGSPKPAFETIIAFNENSAYPHHVPSDKRLSRDSAVLMDLGCTIGGYRSDLTRTGFFGSMNGKFRKIYDIVKRAQAEGIGAVREGVTAGEADSVCREYIRKAGYGDYFVHSTGHGVGIDIHEPPRLGTGAKEPLKAGMIVTVEPGIYLPGEFGVRIEDTVLVTKGDCRILTRSGA